VILLGVLTNGMTILGVHSFWQNVAQGALLAGDRGRDPAAPLRRASDRDSGLTTRFVRSIVRLIA
jgi:hypothetical protein